MKNKFRLFSIKILVPVLGVAMLISIIFSMFTIRSLQGNARVINYTGVVRGATQRLVKQELQHAQDNALIDRLDSILEELGTGEGENNLVKLSSPEYQKLLGKMQIEWADIKKAILDYRNGTSGQQLYRLSESYFDLADQTVFAAEEYAEKVVHNTELVLILVNLVFILIMGLVFGLLIVYLQRHHRDILKANETETEEERARLEQLSRDIKAPLDQLSEMMYVSDLETYDLLFVNSAGRETFHLDSLEGEKCYKALQGLDAPCPFCTTPELKAGENHTWEHTNLLTKRHYLLKDRPVIWDGRPARFEIAFDMTEEIKEKQELKNMLGSERVLVECLQVLYQNRDLGQAINYVLKHIGQFLNADRAYIFELKDEQYATNTYEWCADIIRSEMDNLQCVSLEPFVRWIDAYKKDGYLVIDNIEELHSMSQAEYELLMSQNIQTLVTVSLERDGELYALIGVDNPSPGLKDNAVSLLQALRYFLMLAVKRAENEETMNKLSYYDTLTSFYNRNRYMQDLESFSEMESPMGIVYLDLNGLKDVNDQRGHAAGDRMLVECAKYIRESFKDSDLYRIGGDEFIIIYKGGSREEFSEKTEELRLRFKQSECCCAAIGSQWALNGRDINATVAAADKKMYSDKQAFYSENCVSKRYRHGVHENL